MDFFKKNWVVILIFLIAAIFRFWQINGLPGGLFPDEAANGLDVNEILNGNIQPFYERGNGREALFFYFLALSVAIFGRGVWQHHVVSAGFGLMATFAIYFLVKRMFGKRTALLASFFMAISSYAVTISRTAFRANTIPLFTTLTLLFLVKYFQEKNIRTKIYSAVFAGLSFGLGFYTYISSRMMIPLLFGFALLILFAVRDQLKSKILEHKRAIFAFAASFLIAFSWLGLYFVQHPENIVGRAGQVSIFSPDLNKGDVVGTFLNVSKKTAKSFFTEGDLNWRHNVSGFPFLSPFLSPFFAIGLIIFSIEFLKLLKQVWLKKIEPQTVYKSLVAVWFWFMLIPEITTAEGIPHGLRLIGVIPAIFILPAWVLNFLWEKIKAFSYLRPTRAMFAGIFLLFLFVYNFQLYFVTAAKSPEYYYTFRSDLTEVSDYLNKRNQKNKTYLSLDAFSVQTVDYLTTETNKPYHLILPEKTYEARLNRGDQVIFTQSTIFDEKKFRDYHPEAKLIVKKTNQFGEIIMMVYERL